MKKNVILILLAFITVSVFAKENPRVAVVPFNPVGVSENEAMVITSLFETALVQTESFDVIEQNQISEIMDAQAYTMTGCTDESCAIEVGKLLAAEQIILGELSSIGGKFILNAKIIDVEQGKNIKADKVEASGMGEMTNAAELLAFKLAGLTYSSGGEVEIAQAFGEALIETNPSGAEIFINGVKKGVSPDLISKLPLGTIRIEAKKGNLYAVEQVAISSDTAMITLVLKEQYGNLFIKSSERDVKVYFDGKLLGDLGTGFFNKLSVGQHNLELKGQDLYWSEMVDLEPDVSTKVDAYPRGMGYLQYTLPEKAEAVVSGIDFRQVVRGSGTLQLFEGKFTIEAGGEIYNSYQQKITVAKGNKIPFAPEMEFTQEHQDLLARQERDRLYKSLSSELNDKKELILPEHRIVDEELDSLSMIGRNITEADFPDLLTEWVELNSEANERKKLQDSLDQYLVQKQELYSQVNKLTGARTSHKVNGWVSAGIGGGSAVLSIVSFILSWTNYQEYLTAGETEWEELKEAYQMWDMVGYVSAGTAALGGGLSPVFLLTGPKDDDIAGPTARLTYVNSEIDRLERALQ